MTTDDDVDNILLSEVRTSKILCIGVPLGTRRVVMSPVAAHFARTVIIATCDESSEVGGSSEAFLHSSGIGGSSAELRLITTIERAEWGRPVPRSDTDHFTVNKRGQHWNREQFF